MDTTHHQKWLAEKEQLSARLGQLRSQAGIDATAQVGRDEERRRCFGIAHIELRRNLMQTVCRLEAHEARLYASLAEDARETVAHAALRAQIPPWIIPSLITCTAIALGWRIYPIIGDLCGLAVGFYASHAYIGYTKGKRKQELAAARGWLSRYESDAQRPPATATFSESECESGQPDP